MSKLRYPGAQPFSEKQKGIFFGRKKPIKDLYRLIRQSPLVVLYSKSGLGKSSLLNAGIIPKVKEAKVYRPVPIRFLAHSKDSDNKAPLYTTCTKVKESPNQPNTFLDQLLENEKSLWHDLKEEQINSNDDPGILLIFDQFEELFTYPPEQQLEFRKQLAEALYTPLPQRYWDILDLYTPKTMPLTEEQLALLQKPLNIRVVLAIREDRVHLLGNLKDYLPTVSNNWYELEALDEESAEEAIIKPAQLKGDFITPPFTYTKGAVNKMIHFLTDEGEEKIAGTQLQIVCNTIERKVENLGVSNVDSETVGDLEVIIENYYEEKIDAINTPEQELAARVLIEDGLIFEEEERRLSLYEGQIFKNFSISPETLQLLVNSHLLRAEPSLKGGYTYELSHDTLVAPVLKAKQKRLAIERAEKAELLRKERKEALAEAEAKAEKERQRAELEAGLRRTAEKRTRYAFVLSLLALALAAFAGWQTYKSVLAANSEREARGQADKNLQLAIANEKIAKENENIARREKENAILSKNAETKALEEAKANLTLAQINEQKARENAALAETQKQKALDAAQKEKIATQEAKSNLQLALEKEAEAKSSAALAKQARENAEEALVSLQEANKETAELLHREISQNILELNYLGAWEKIKAALELKAKEPESKKLAQEVAFFYAESNQFELANRVLKHLKLSDHSDINSIRNTIQKLEPNNYQLLQFRYYPEMLTIEGGDFKMGDNIRPDEQPIHQVQISGFEIAKTETTVWQYFLFCRANNLPLPEKPVWGWFGNHPIREVNWNEAVLYNNWVSTQKGYEPIYAISSQAFRKDALDNKVSLNKITGGKSIGYRLPTEAEWEYAARGGSSGKNNVMYSGGTALDMVGWYVANSNGRTQMVGSKAPNEAGLYDMSGNVWEWCWDWYQEGYYQQSPEKDPNGPQEGIDRVVRGGSWFLSDNYSRTAYRGRSKPNLKGNNYGFRCARSQ